MTTVAIPFAQVRPEQNPNIRSASLDNALSIYLDAALTCLSSIHRWNPAVNLVFATNAPVPEWFSDGLHAIGARTAYIDFDHEPPPGYAETFAGSFYIVDVLGGLEYDGSLILVDPDVFCTASIDEMLRAASSQIGALTMPYAEGQVVNGLSRKRVAEMAESIGGGGEVGPHFGGELFVIPLALRSQLLDSIESAWKWSLTSFASGGPHFTTEEHLISYALRASSVATLNPYARRIWTANKHRNLLGDEDRLSLWHLPAEKERGFREIRPVREASESWFWSADREQYTRNAGRVFGVYPAPARRVRYLFGDIANLVSWFRSRSGAGR